MSAVLEGREEAGEVLLRQSTLNHFFTARLVYHGLHFVDGDVSILVSIDPLTQILLKLNLSLELSLQEAVHLHELPLDHVQFVRRHFLRV